MNVPTFIKFTPLKLKDTHSFSKSVFSQNNKMLHSKKYNSMSFKGISYILKTPNTIWHHVVPSGWCWLMTLVSCDRWLSGSSPGSWTLWCKLQVSPTARSLRPSWWSRTGSWHHHGSTLGARQSPPGVHAHTHAHTSTSWVTSSQLNNSVWCK